LITAIASYDKPLICTGDNTINSDDIIWLCDEDQDMPERYKADDCCLSVRKDRTGQEEQPKKKSLWSSIIGFFSGIFNVDSSVSNGKTASNIEQEWIKIVTDDPMQLQNAPEEIKNNRNVVKAAVSIDGMALMYASDELINDREIVLAAVDENALAMMCASAELKNDESFVREAASLGGNALMYASDELKNNREFMKEMISKEARNIQFASDELKNDRELVLAAVSNWGEALCFASDELKNDRELVSTAILQSKGTALKYASDELKNDRELVWTAVQGSNGGAIQYASEELRNNREFARLVALSYYNSLQFLGSDMQDYYNETYKKAFSILDIDKSKRFDKSEYAELVRNRYSVSTEETKKALKDTMGEEFFSGVENDTRPICVMIAAESDWSGALGDIGHQQFAQVGRNYKVIYYDVSTDKEFAENLCEATTDNGQQADLLLIAGHGNKRYLCFGTGVIMFPLIQESSMLDRTLDWDMVEKIKDCVKEGGDVVLVSCSTGKGGKGPRGVNNVAEFMLNIWPNARIHSPMNDVSQVNYEFDANGRLASVVYDNSRTDTLVLENEDYEDSRSIFSGILTFFSRLWPF